ncbi:unnamed protein product [Ilex paraguariensis]|uniref:SHSP domain-containing protein n=1 Tax=Ilex paraguariensis TaxID=185542 RepID=A0ABC8SFI2_9AQUA
MANTMATKGVADGKNTQNSIFEELDPSSSWTEDSTFHYLLIDLPGFKMEEVTLEVDKYGHILVHGERPVSENKFIRFKQTFNVPENSNIEDIAGKFEDGLLYVAIPKYETKDMGEEENEHEKREHDENFREGNVKQGDGNGYDHEEERVDEKEEFHEAHTENQWGEAGLFETVKEKLKKNKGIVITAILAFSVGVLMAQKFQSNED